MSQLQMILGEDGAKFALWSLLGLAIILVAIVALLAYRRLFGASFNMNGLVDRRNRPARLGVTDFFNLDRQGRKLVIVRRDNVEHLVLIGGPNDLLIEQNIIRGIRPELPVVETLPRPTVTAKITDEPTAEVSTDAPQKTEPTPVTSIISRFNTPKLNIPNLDLRATMPVQKSVSVKTEPSRLMPKTLETEIHQELKAQQEPKVQQKASPVNQPARFKEPTDTTLSLETLSPETRSPTAKPAPSISETTQEKPKAPEPAKQPISSAFGDATKRLEEALRRPPTSFESKSFESKSFASKPAEQAHEPATTENPNGLKATSVTNVAKAEPQPKLDAEILPQPTKIPPVTTDTLVLDLEQEMARLLGRVPGKGA